jgi:hypothetical protein
MSDQGEAFYPNFTDAQAPRTIEVVDYDEATATRCHSRCSSSRASG